MPSEHTQTLFGLAFAAVAAGFLASTIYVEGRSSAIDREIGSMEVNSAPSVAYLASARGALRHLQSGVERFERAPLDGREAAKEVVLAAEAELSREIAGEVGTPNYAGEVEAYALTKRNIDEIEDAIANWFANTHGSAPPRELDLSDAFDRADAALSIWSAINGSGQTEEIARIKEVRTETLRLALLLDGACAALAIGAAGIALRALRRQREVEAAHAQLLLSRADDLEMFAKRVAHDLLSPLSSLAFLLGTIDRNVTKGAPVSEPLVRADACLRRSRRLVDGALEFARAGASTMGAGRADLREAIDGVIDDVRADEAKGAEVVVEPFGNVVVACPAGVLASILSNLVRNAVKFSEERELRRITVRASGGRGPAAGEKHCVRVEVEDTGPGLPTGLEASVFEPYVRGSDAKPGLGLGLATVRRFVEGYGGKVGVDSSPAQGCVFWFELPTAQTVDALPSPARTPVLDAASRGGTATATRSAGSKPGLA